MSKFLKWIVAPAVLAAGFLWVAPSEANAQGFSIRIGGGGYRGYSGYSSYYAPRRSGVSFYYNSAPSYRYYSTPRVYYGGHGYVGNRGRGRGHYDYYPGHFDYHNGHYDYHPAHFDYHGPGHPSHGH